MPIDISYDLEPVIVIRWAGLPTNEEFRAYLRDYSRYVKRPMAKKQVAIFDATEASVPSALHRQEQAQWMQEHQEVLRRIGLGTSFVIRSALIRGALTAVFWVQPIPTPHALHANMEDAYAWALELLRAENIAIPSALTRRIASK